MWNKYLKFEAPLKIPQTISKRNPRRFRWVISVINQKNHYCKDSENHLIAPEPETTTTIFLHCLCSLQQEDVTFFSFSRKSMNSLNGAPNRCSLVILTQGYWWNTTYISSHCVTHEKKKLPHPTMYPRIHIPNVLMFIVHIPLPLFVWLSWLY